MVWLCPFLFCMRTHDQARSRPIVLVVSCVWQPSESSSPLLVDIQNVMNLPPVSFDTTKIDRRPKQQTYPNEKLYSRRCLWNVYRDQRSSCHFSCFVHVNDSSNHCQQWHPHAHHQNVEECIGCCRAIFHENGSESRHTHVWARNGVLTPFWRRWNARGQQRYVFFITKLRHCGLALAQFPQMLIHGCHCHANRKRIVANQRV